MLLNTYTELSCAGNSFFHFGRKNCLSDSNAVSLFISTAQ